MSESDKMQFIPREVLKAKGDILPYATVYKNKSSMPSVSRGVSLILVTAQVETPVVTPRR